MSLRGHCRSPVASGSRPAEEGAACPHPFAAVRGPLPPCPERAVGLARCHLTQNKEVLVKPGTEKDTPEEI